MAAYYVLGICFVLFAVGLTALGLMREGFPPSPSGGRTLMAVAGVIALVTFGVLLASTEREHPREEAKKEAAEKKAEAAPPGAPPEKSGGPGTAQKGAVEVVEKEYSISLPGGEDLKAGKVSFEVSNEGAIQHDLAVEGDREAKTPLIAAGKQASLDVDLEPGKYKLYCTVPGHEQLGMKAEVTVGA